LVLIFAALEQAAISARGIRTWQARRLVDGRSFPSEADAAAISS